jgi:hypothetical protein
LQLIYQWTSPFFPLPSKDTPLFANTLSNADLNRLIASFRSDYLSIAHAISTVVAHRFGKVMAILSFSVPAFDRDIQDVDARACKPTAIDVYLLNRENVHPLLG